MHPGSVSMCPTVDAGQSEATRLRDPVFARLCPHHLAQHQVLSNHQSSGSSATEAVIGQVLNTMKPVYF